MLTARLILERLDKDGGLLERREQPARSFLRNFIGLLYCAHAQITYNAPYSMTDITGTARAVDSQAWDLSDSRAAKGNLMVAAAPGLAGVTCPNGNRYFRSNNLAQKGENIGIQVGTGTAPPTPTDNALAARIAHGRATGQLEYGGCELIGIAFADPNGEFTIRRYFTNASGGSITVNEVGIHSIGTDSYTVSLCVWAFLIARDVVSPGVAVANNELLRVTYVPQITV